MKEKLELRARGFPLTRKKKEGILDYLFKLTNYLIGGKYHKERNSSIYSRFDNNQ